MAHRVARGWDSLSCRQAVQCRPLHRSHPILMQSSGRKVAASESFCEGGKLRGIKDLQATVVDSVLIPWFAFQNQSVLAAEALVETVTSLYRTGWSVERIQMELSFLTLQQRQGIDQMQRLDSEMLLSFVALIMITCKEVKCPLYPEASLRSDDGVSDSQTKQIHGLQQYATQTLQQYTNGATLKGMRRKQEKARQSMQHSSSATNPPVPGADPSRKAASPQMMYMQNLTRIVLLTIESLQQRGLAPTRSVLIPQLRDKLGMAAAGTPAQNSSLSARQQPTGFAAHLQPPTTALYSHAVLLNTSSPLKTAQRRWLAVTLLLSFMGASLGWSVSWQQLINTALLAYLAGASAQEIFDELQPEEFSQAGEMFKAVSSANVQAEQINAEAFALWLSIAYMTWAQLGLPHPLSGSEDGWAWVVANENAAQPPGMVAQATSDFVARTLVHLEGTDGAVCPVDDDDTLEEPVQEGEGGQRAAAGRTLQSLMARNKQVDTEWLAERLAQVQKDAISRAQGHMTIKIADPDLARNSSAMAYMIQQSSVVNLARQAAAALSCEPFPAEAPARGSPS